MKYFRWNESKGYITVQSCSDHFFRLTPLCSFFQGVKPLQVTHRFYYFKQHLKKKRKEKIFKAYTVHVKK